MRPSLRQMIAAAAPVPVLDLQFQNGVLDPRIAFARASTAWYFDAAGILQTSNSGVARFASLGPAGGQVGLLMEGAATNLALWSRDLTQSGTWVVSALSSVAKDQTGIDGVANSASSFTAGADNATVLQTLGLGSASRTYSVFLKRLTGTGTVSITPDGTNYTTVVLTAAWQRFQVNATVVPIIGIKLATTGDAVAVDINQDETGAFATSPIITTNATVTRAAETASMPLSLVPRLDPLWTWQVAFQLEGAAASGTNQSVITFDDGSANNRITLQRTGATGNFAGPIVVGGSQTVSLAGATASANTMYRWGQKNGPGQQVASQNGGTLVLGAAAIPANTVLTTLRIGSNVAGASQANGVFYRIRMWRPGLPNAVVAHNSFVG